MREQNDCITNRDKTYSLTPARFHRSEGGFIMGNVLSFYHCFIFYHLKVTVASLTNFKCYHPDTSMSFAI